MKNIIKLLSVASALWAGSVCAQFELGTTFNYQGSLNQAGLPAIGDFDFEFALFDASVDGIEVSAAVAVADVSVDDGLFTVPLDFGSVFDGADLYLEIRVRDASDTASEFTVLQPRQAILPTPYAMYANRAATAATVEAGGVTAESISPGIIDTDKLSAAARSTLSAPDGDPAIAVAVDDSGSVSTSSDLMVAGQLNADSANVTGAVTASSVDASGTVIADAVTTNTVNAITITIEGAELRLGTDDGIPVGANPNQRALSHGTGDVLNVNAEGDFEGGTVIAGDTHVTGNITLDGVLSGRVIGGAYVACTGNSASNLSCSAWGSASCSGGACLQYQCASGTLRTVSSANECYAAGSFGRTCYSMLCVE